MSANCKPEFDLTQPEGLQHDLPKSPQLCEVFTVNWLKRPKPQEWFCEGGVCHFGKCTHSLS